MRYPGECVLILAAGLPPAYLCAKALNTAKGILNWISIARPSKLPSVLFTTKPLTMEEKKSFFRSTTFYIMIGILVAGLIAWLLLKPKPGSDGCNTIKWEILDEMLGENWNDPTKENFAMGLWFKTEKGDQNKITIYPVGKNGLPVTSRAVEVEVSSDTDCALPAGDIRDLTYELQSGDAGSDGRLFKFDFLRMVPETSTDGMVEYRLEFVEDGEVKRSERAKPCPPYCPRPAE